MITYDSFFSFSVQRYRSSSQERPFIQSMLDRCRVLFNDELEVSKGQSIFDIRSILQLLFQWLEYGYPTLALIFCGSIDVL